ncbi:hypothetical protein NHX12_002435 [Muraenolepis orangiensis]|uniref:C-type lectin domain-containing protein n=1 Tax=Muraenolepis orangiensis TaxID=630683 RepID=A0A9Q0DYG6_9TELE|nr:hypothetical protein NHX12_002435 [Muraenolepis orangiensis]
MKKITDNVLFLPPSLPLPLPRSLPLLASLLLLLLPGLARGTPRPEPLEECYDTTCFLLLEVPLNFSAAQDACSAQNGQLATLRSPDEWRKAQRLLLRSDRRFWIGLVLPDDVRCPSAGDSELHGYEWITGSGVAVAFPNWMSSPDRCDHRCVSASTNGLCRQEPCGGTLDGFLCAVLPGRCPASERRAAPGVHAVSSGDSRDAWLPPAAEWTTRGTSDGDSRHFNAKWLCAWSAWWRAPWVCEVMKGGCEHTCKNNSCACPAGQKLHTNNFTCVEAKECRLDKDCERDNTRCVFSHTGIHTSACVCQDGYEEEDGVCVDVLPPRPAASPTAGGVVPAYVRVGLALGITVFVAVGVALLYLLLQYCLARSEAPLGCDTYTLTLQQLTA